jgi:hypothetical protein
MAAKHFIYRCSLAPQPMKEMTVCKPQAGKRETMRFIFLLRNFTLVHKRLEKEIGS